MTTQERLAMQFGNEYIGQFILLAQVARRTCDHDVLSRITTASGKWYEVVYMVFLANVTATVKALTTLRGVLVLNIFKCVLPSSPFFYGTTAAMVTNAFTFKTLPYDPDKDFIPVALIGRSPFVIAASPASGIRSMADAIARAKAQPDKVAIATEGPKTFAGMLADSVASMAGVKFTHVPYTKAPDAIQDVLGGRVPLG